MVTRNDDFSLILAKAKMNGMFPDVGDNEVGVLTEQAKILFKGDSAFTDSFGGTPDVQSLSKWVKKRTLSQLNQSPTRVLCVGDSTTAGVYSDSYTTAIGSTNQGGPNSYPSQLASRLTAFGLPSEYSLCLPGHSGNDDSRWPISTNWGYASAGGFMGAGGNAAMTSSTGVNPTNTITPGVSANTYKIYYYGDPGTGAMSITATGGAAVPIDTANATPGTYFAIVSASAVSTANAVVITRTAGTVFIVGIESYNSTSPNKIRILNAGVGGTTAVVWANDTNANSFGGRAFIKALAPDLTIISLGINDGGASTDTTAVINAVKLLAGDAKLSGDVVIMSAFPHGNASVLDQYNEAFKNAGYPYIDIQNRWGYAGQTMQFLTTDNTHPNALGYGDIATAVAQKMLSV